MKRDSIVLEVNGFNISVKWWENHINVEFPLERVRPAEKGKEVELTMADMCDGFSRYFKFEEDGEGRTCLRYFENDGVKHKPGPKKKIDINERGPRKAVIKICGHEIRATVSVDKRNVLALTLPKNSIGNDFTFHDLCRVLPEKFELNRRFKVIHIKCIK